MSNNKMVMIRSVAFFDFKLQKTVLIEYSYPKRSYNSREKILLRTLSCLFL